MRSTLPYTAASARRWASRRRATTKGPVVSIAPPPVKTKKSFWDTWEGTAAIIAAVIIAIGVYYVYRVATFKKDAAVPAS